MALMNHQVSSEIHEVCERSRAVVLSTACLGEAKSFPHGTDAWGDRLGAACATRGSVGSPSESCQEGTPGPCNCLCCYWFPGIPHSGTDDVLYQ